jgi:hypothetical protein
MLHKLHIKLQLKVLKCYNGHHFNWELPGKGNNHTCHVVFIYDETSF